MEQADIKDLTVTANAEKGCTVSMVVISPSGSRVVRSFRPDFFLCRQSVRDAAKDYRNVLLGLNIGGVPSINSLSSLYNFQVRIVLCRVTRSFASSKSNNKKVFVKKEKKTFDSDVFAIFFLISSTNNLLKLPKEENFYSSAVRFTQVYTGENYIFIKMYTSKRQFVY